MSDSGRKLSSPDLDVRRVSIDDVHPDPANARKHGQRNLDAIRGSIRQFGQVEPLVVQRSTGKVIGGNGRLEVMRSMGFESIDIVEVDLDDTQATVLGLALNRTAELAEWDLDVLDELTRSIGDIEDIGFSEDDIATMLPSDDDDRGHSPDTTDYEPLRYSVIVDFDDEHSQASMLRRLESEGHKCRLLIS